MPLTSGSTVSAATIVATFNSDNVMGGYNANIQYSDQQWPNLVASGTTASQADWQSVNAFAPGGDNNGLPTSLTSTSLANTGDLVTAQSASGSRFNDVFLTETQRYTQIRAASFSYSVIGGDTATASGKSYLAASAILDTTGLTPPNTGAVISAGSTPATPMTYATPGAYTYTVPSGVTQVSITYPSLTGVITTTVTVTPGASYTVTIGGYGSESSFDTLLVAPAYSTTVGIFDGNVDNDLYNVWGVGTASGSTYTGSGDSATLSAGAAAAGCYYTEYGEGFHGDLSADITMNTALTGTFINPLQVSLANVSGRPSPSVNAQPNSTNNYQATIYTYDGSGGEGTAHWEIVLQQVVSMLVTPLGASGATVNAQVLVVGGGGGGGSVDNANAGGGGAGGFIETTRTLDSGTTYAVTVGAGGAGGSGGPSNGGQGGNSVFDSLTAVGGGGGGFATGGSGGSGGGGAQGYPGGAGTAGQGSAGSAGGDSTTSFASGGGGGAGAVGSQSDGGNGLQSSITGTATYYAGGGAGQYNRNSSVPFNGGLGGGGGSVHTGAGPNPGYNGTDGLGGGGGGASNNGTAGTGGSGVVIIRYSSSTQLFSGGVVTRVGGDYIHTFASTGTFSLVGLGGGGAATGINGYFSQLRAIQAVLPPASISVTVCHVSCHSSCHGSRGRR